MVYQAVSLVLGCLSLDIHSLWVLHLIVSLVLLFKFKILNVHATHKNSRSGGMIACTLLCVNITSQFFLPLCY